MTQSVPILLLSDSVDAHSGLARITRDIAGLLSRLSEFRVGTMGRGGRASSRLPWPQFVIPDQDWGEAYLSECWRDFAGNERGVLLSIWNPSRVRYQVMATGLDEATRQFLNEGRFEKWLYCPIDASGPRNQLTGILGDTIKRFDRVAAYTLWGQDLIQRSTGRTDVDWLPHGINFNAFQPRDRSGSRLVMGVSQEDTVIGCVMTNQTRKDWGTVLCAFDQLRRLRPALKLWCHVDTMIRHWNLHSLIQDYQLQEHVLVTMSGTLSDKELSWYYSGCDLTILPSSEGFGYCIVESLACGVPCIHSSYAGGAELVPNKDWLVEPLTYRLDGIYNDLRPVWDVQHWVDAITGFFERGRWTPEECRRSIEHLAWSNLKTPWENWMRSGIGFK